jgi:hypothetical protein
MQKVREVAQVAQQQWGEELAPLQATLAVKCPGRCRV